MIDSKLIGVYFFSEIFKNQDISYSSTRFYITKKAGDENYKLYAGPAWDFDLSSGNVAPHYYGDAATDYKYWKATDMKWFDNGKYKGAAFEQHRYMYRNIMNTLAGHEEYLIKENQNLEVTKAIECFYKSAQLGREVRSCELEK